MKSTAGAELHFNQLKLIVLKTVQNKPPTSDVIVPVLLPCGRTLDRPFTLSCLKHVKLTKFRMLIYTRYICPSRHPIHPVGCTLDIELRGVLILW